MLLKTVMEMEIMLVLFARAQVTDFNIIIHPQEHVLRFQVKLKDFPVDVAQTETYLREMKGEFEFKHLGLLKRAIQAGSKISAFALFNDNTQSPNMEARLV